MSQQEEFINDLIFSMQPAMNEQQLYLLKNTLIIKLHDYTLEKKTTALSTLDNSPESMLKRFIATKRLEGKSEETLRRYYDICHNMILSFSKPLHQIETDDLRFYLASYQNQRKISNRTLDGMRRCFSSFFAWLSAEGLIGRNPCAALSQIKYTKVIKKPFSAEDIERLKRACTSIRDLALIEFLYASGCRVSEVVRLNRSDINFLSRDAIVLGKGNKERTIYLTPVALMHLNDYLSTRTDANPCLFASLKAPYKRLSKSGIEAALKTLGKRAGVSNVHPHRYRRTLATNLLDRGANIQDVAAVLGHEDLKTTQIYCHISQHNVRSAYEKYAG